MGIKGLHKFLRSACPDVFEDIHISDYAYKKVAIDISLYMYLFKASCGDFWLRSFIKLVECLRKYELHCVFIFDGKATPDKDKERKKRAEIRAKNEEKVYKLEEAIEHYHETQEIDPILIEFQEKRKIHTKRLLSSGMPSINIKTIEYYVQKLRKNIFEVTEADFNLAKKLFDILNVPYFQAPTEAETMCSDLCKKGLVEAVLSKDSDVLAYGAPIFLTNIDINTGLCQRVLYENVLEQLDFDSSQFLDFCIMCGTDYNDNIFRIGPKGAYKLMKEHKTLDNIENNTKLDTTVLNFRRVRELFSEYPSADLINISYCGAPNFDKLKEFVEKNNISITIENLKESFIQPILVFED